MKRIKKIFYVFLLSCISLLLILNTASSQETAGQLFEKALYLEEGKGDLKAAVAIYEKIVGDEAADRSLRADAQLHIGICWEKMGRDEAHRAYWRVINDFPEQLDEVSIARDRLTSLELELVESNRKPIFRKIEIANKPQNGILSPDGNELAFMSEGAVWVVPLHGKVDPDIAGEPVRLANIPGLWEGGEMLSWSADGNWITVYGGNPDSDDGSVVSIIPVNGGTTRLVQLPEQGGHQWSYRMSLSPDGQMLAFSAIEIDKPREEVLNSHHRYIYTIPTKGGQPKKISSNWARLPSYSPDGKFIAYVGYRLRDDWQENEDRHPYIGDLWMTTSAGVNPLKLASVDGRLRGPIWSPDCKYIAAHLEPGKSNASNDISIFRLSADTSSAKEIKRIKLPRSSWHMLAGWTPDDELGVFMSTEEHSAIYTVPINDGKAVQISPSGGWPYYPRWSPDGKHIYYRGFNEGEDKVSALSIPASGGDPVTLPALCERRLVSCLPGGGFNISPDGNKIIFSAYQEPYDPIEGVDIWIIGLDDGLPTRLTSDNSFEGYPCWFPDGRLVAFIDWYEKSDDEGFDAIYMVSAEGGEARMVSSEADSVDRGAIAFSPGGGRIAFFSRGAIKTMPVEGGAPEVLVASVKSDRHSQLAYSHDGTMIAHSAWPGKIWITLLAEGVPKELHTGLPNNNRLSEFSWSPDGSKIAFVSNIGGEAEFWLIKDFIPE